MPTSCQLRFWPPDWGRSSAGAQGKIGERSERSEEQMLTGDYLLVVAGMGLVTYGPRWAPLFFMARKELPSWLVEWLDLIPAAILSALLLPELLLSGHPPRLELFQPKLIAAFPTFAFALKTRSLGGTVVIGMLLYWLAGKLL
jgi:branched-subunit amino acid transport protein